MHGKMRPHRDPAKQLLYSTLHNRKWIRLERGRGMPRRQAGRNTVCVSRMLRQALFVQLHEELEEMSMRFFELVGVFDLDAIPGGEGDEDYNFRVEITREVGEESRFLGRLYRRESYRIQPTFPLADSQTVALRADHELFVVDDMMAARSRGIRRRKCYEICGT